MALLDSGWRRKEGPPARQTACKETPPARLTFLTPAPARTIIWPA